MYTYTYTHVVGNVHNNALYKSKKKTYDISYIDILLTTTNIEDQGCQSRRRKHIMGTKFFFFSTTNYNIYDYIHQCHQLAHLVAKVENINQTVIVRQ